MISQTQSPAKTRKAVGYFRVSTPGQTGERHVSLETQQRHYLEYCSRYGMISTATFTDVASGKKTDRQEYQQMLRFVMDGNADIIVTQFLDRFGRNPKEILSRYWQLQEAGVEIAATDEDLKEELVLLIKAGLAGAESRRNSERTRSNMRHAVSKGVHMGPAPYGLRKITITEGPKKTSKWETIPVEAEAVRLMYHMAVDENIGYKSIADRLTEKGYRARGGKPFKTYTIAVILRNPALMGTYRWGKEPRSGAPQEPIEMLNFYPAILSKEEWSKLQERLQIRRETPRGRAHVSDYVLSGILRCGHCGGPMIGHAQRTSKYFYRRYGCSRAIRSKEFCQCPNQHSADPLEKTVLDYLGEFNNPEKVRDLVEKAHEREDQRTGIEVKQRELGTSEKRLSQLQELVLKDIDRLDRGILSEAEYTAIAEVRRSEIFKLKETIGVLTKEIEADKAKSDTVEKVPIQIRSFFNDFQRLDIRQQKARLQEIVKAIYIWNDNRMEIEFR